MDATRLWKYWQDEFYRIGHTVDTEEIKTIAKNGRRVTFAGVEVGKVVSLDARTTLLAAPQGGQGLARFHLLLDGKWHCSYYVPNDLGEKYDTIHHCLQCIYDTIPAEAVPLVAYVRDFDLSLLHSVPCTRQ